MESVEASDTQRTAERLGLATRAICLHSSLRSFGSGVTTPEAVVDGLIAAGCTVLVPTFSWSAYALPPPPQMRPPRNGTDYVGPFRQSHSRKFSRSSVAIDDDMGAIPRHVVERRERARGDHPLASFAAIGPLAEQLVATQTAADPFAPLRELVAVKGAVVLAGVGLTSMTLIHLAEQQAGRAPFLRWAAADDGSTLYAAVGGCSDGFDALESVIHSKDSYLGASRWRSFDAETTVAAAAAAIRANPGVTGCGRAECERCRDIDAARHA